MKGLNIPALLEAWTKRNPFFMHLTLGDIQAVPMYMGAWLRAEELQDDPMAQMQARQRRTKALQDFIESEFMVKAKDLPHEPERPA